jgi:hypothetical protein
MKPIRLILITFLISASSFGFAQLTEPGDGSGGVDGAPGPVGGGAPIGSGLAIAIALGAAYGGHKTFHLKKERS